jgi:hypothetical protein
LGLAGAFGFAGAFGLAGAFGFAGALVGAAIEASVPTGIASTTNGIGVVAAGSGTLYGAVVLAGSASTGLALTPNKLFKKSNISVS